jgi:hypothetical protein
LAVSITFPSPFAASEFCHKPQVRTYYFIKYWSLYYVTFKNKFLATQEVGSRRAGASHAADAASAARNHNS